MLDEQQFLEDIKNITGNALGSFCKLIKKDKEKLSFIETKTSFLDEINPDIPTRLYYIRNNVVELLRCKHCLKGLKSFRKQFCNRKCSVSWLNNNDEDYITKKSKGLSEAYNKKTEEEKLQTKQKRVATNIEKYGVTNNMHIPEVREKTKENWIDKFGFDNPNKNAEIKTKISKTKLSKSDEEKNEIKNKVKTTCTEKYGVDNSFHIPEIQIKRQLKIKQTCFKKYGASCYLASSFHNRLNNKTSYTGLNKKVYNLLCQVFEDYTIRSEHFLKNGNSHNFFDFYIEELNLLIEANGDYRHMDPRKYKEDDIFQKGTKNECLAKDIWKKDKNKKDNAENLGYKTLTIWESDLNKNKEEVIKILEEEKLK